MAQGGKGRAGLPGLPEANSTRWRSSWIISRMTCCRVWWRKREWQVNDPDSFLDLDLALTQFGHSLAYVRGKDSLDSRGDLFGRGFVMI